MIPGLTAKTVDGVSGFSYPLIFLPFISSAFVPTAGMPAPVRWFAEHQPVTAVVDTLRALFTGQPVGPDIWVALAWLVAILVVAYAAALAGAAQLLTDEARTAGTCTGKEPFNFTVAALFPAARVAGGAPQVPTGLLTHQIARF